MNKIANRQVICDTLMGLAKDDKNIYVLTSDSKGLCINDKLCK